MRRTIGVVILVGFHLALDFPCDAQSAGEQVARSLELTIQKTVETKCLLYLPPGYEMAEQQWPLLLFLHGIGERGDDIELVKRHGPPKMIAGGKEFPFVVVSPQCPEDEWRSLDVLNALLDEIIEKYRIDEDRIYVTGLSMGGYGAWRLAYTYPDRFAAVAPICGGGNPEKAVLMKDIPTWAFHGARDETVPVERSKEMVDALKAAGGTVRFTVYSEAGHVEAWQNAYSNPELWEWLGQQRRPK